MSNEEHTGRVRVKVTQRINPEALYVPSHYGCTSPDQHTAYNVGLRQNGLVPFSIEPGYGWRVHAGSDRHGQEGRCVMARYGMLINTKKCHRLLRLPRGVPAPKTTFCPTRTSSATRRRRRARYPAVRVETVPLQCMHCEDAPCAAVWPDRCGLHRHGRHRAGLTMGAASAASTAWPPAPIRCACSTRRRARWNKCRFCTVSAETSGTQMCSCVEACLTGARLFGDLDDPESDIAQEIARPRTRSPSPAI